MSVQVEDSWGLRAVRTVAAHEADPAFGPAYYKSLRLSESVRFGAIAEGVVDMVWTAPEALSQRDGVIQGGIIAVVGDAAQQFTYLTMAEGFHAYATNDFNIRYLAPIPAGEIVDIQSRVISRGRRITVIETSFFLRRNQCLATRIVGAWSAAARGDGPPRPTAAP